MEIYCKFLVTARSPVCHQPIPDPEEYLRQKLALRPGDAINLWSLPDPEPGQRPPHSYPLLVRLAIYGSPNKRMTLKQIYEAIENRFEYYRNQPKGAWKVSNFFVRPPASCSDALRVGLN